MTLRYIRWFVFCIVLAIIVWTFQYFNGDWRFQRTVPTIPFMRDMTGGRTNTDTMSTDKTTMEQRLHRKTKACVQLMNQSELLDIKRRSFRYEPVIVYVKRYNLSYCAAGKTGTTYIKQIFTILLNGENRVKLLEDSSRRQTHQNLNQYIVEFQNRTWKKARVITVGRNPYSRLFSAYVDRISVPTMTPPLREGGRCLLDVSFEEFLKIILNNTEMGKMDIHWSPVFYICKPCEIRSTYIFKQESYIKDIHYMKLSLNLTKDRLEAVNRKLNAPSIEWSVRGVVKDMTAITSKIIHNPLCVGWLEAIQRIWKAFQIQGYIDERVDLPKHLYMFNDTKQYSEDDLVQTILTTISKYPLSSDQRKAQRERAIVQAYREISNKTIYEIKRIFRPDFEMFGYSDEPPL